jgi:hypothetical protein
MDSLITSIPRPTTGSISTTGSCNKETNELADHSLFSFAVTENFARSMLARLRPFIGGSRWITSPSAPPAPKKYAILVTGHVSPFCLREYGDYGRLYTSLLRDLSSQEEWNVFSCIDGHFPDENDLDSYKGMVIGGSRRMFLLMSGCV